MAGGLASSTPWPKYTLAKVHPERARRPIYAAQYKLRILAEYQRRGRDERGALLRREGLYSSLISEWRKQRDQGALQALAACGRTTTRASARPGGDAAPPRETWSTMQRLWDKWALPALGIGITLVIAYSVWAR